MKSSITYLLFYVLLRQNSYNIKINPSIGHNSVASNTFTVLYYHHFCLVPIIFIIRKGILAPMKRSILPLNSYSLLPAYPRPVMVNLWHAYCRGLFVLLKSKRFAITALNPYKLLICSPALWIYYSESMSLLALCVCYGSNQFIYWKQFLLVWKTSETVMLRVKMI